MKVDRIYPIRRNDRVEEAMARKLMTVCDDYVPGFGASDSGLDSHFFYFNERSYRHRAFLDLLLDFRMAVGDR